VLGIAQTQLEPQLRSLLLNSLIRQGLCLRCRFGLIANSQYHASYHVLFHAIIMPISRSKGDHVPICIIMVSKDRRNRIRKETLSKLSVCFKAMYAEQSLSRARIYTSMCASVKNI
jgi:hypothetical protein